MLSIRARRVLTVAFLSAALLVSPGFGDALPGAVSTDAAASELLIAPEARLDGTLRATGNAVGSTVPREFCKSCLEDVWPGGEAEYKFWFGFDCEDGTGESDYCVICDGEPPSWSCSATHGSSYPNPCELLSDQCGWNRGQFADAIEGEDYSAALTLVADHANSFRIDVSTDAVEVLDCFGEVVDTVYLDHDLIVSLAKTQADASKNAPAAARQ